MTAGYPMGRALRYALRSRGPGTTKLDFARVRVIKARLAAGDHPAAIARDEGVSKRTIYAIRSGSVWGHVAPHERGEVRS